MASEIILRSKIVSKTKALIAASAYSAEDVLSESATNTVGTAWGFSNCAHSNNRAGRITGAKVISETTSITPRLTLYLYKATPTCELDDNAGNTAPKHADLANYIGQIDFEAMEDTGGDSSAVAYKGVPLIFQGAAADDDLYGVLITRDAFTQTAGDDMTVILEVEQM